MNENLDPYIPENLREAAGVVIGQEEKRMGFMLKQRSGISFFFTSCEISPDKRWVKLRGAKVLHWGDYMDDSYNFTQFEVNIADVEMVSKAEYKHRDNSEVRHLIK